MEINHQITLLEEKLKKLQELHCPKCGNNNVLRKYGLEPKTNLQKYECSVCRHQFIPERTEKKTSLLRPTIKFCPNCKQEAPVVKEGISLNKKQRWGCKKCSKKFTENPERQRRKNITPEIAKKAVEQYGGMKEAAEKLNVSYQTIRNRLQDKQLQEEVAEYMRKPFKPQDDNLYLEKVETIPSRKQSKVSLLLENFLKMDIPYAKVKGLNRSDTNTFVKLLRSAVIRNPDFTGIRAIERDKEIYILHPNYVEPTINMPAVGRITPGSQKSAIKRWKKEWRKK